MAQVTNYDLLKYSRSYSPDDPARFSHQPTSSDSEWQHFANPKLQLLLSNASPLLSANVKIIWDSVQQETNGILVCRTLINRVAFVTPNDRKTST